MSAVESPPHLLLGASIIALLAAYVYQRFLGAHYSQQQRLGPGSGSVGQRRLRELTLHVDEVPAGTSVAKLESELQSIVAASPDLRGQLDGFAVRLLAPRDHTCARATLTVSTLLPEDQLLTHLQRASKELPYRFGYTFYSIPPLYEHASVLDCESTTNAGLTTIPDKDLVSLGANNSATASSTVDSRLGPSIDQAGSSYNGNATVHGGSLHQGNIVNIQQTADRCLADLRVTDPRHDKKRIQDTKGGLLEDCYVWVLDKPEFYEWRHHKDRRLLWVKGDPGKGKTMLLCGILNQLETRRPKGRFLSYFFCQAADERINTATGVLRGLIFMLLDQEKSLVSHMKEKYDTAGKALFKDANAWQALSEIFTNMLRDPKLRDVYLVVDALDECIRGLSQLLELIIEISQSTRVKWLVSSRNEPEIETQLCNVAHRLSLEVNAVSVAAAVDSYITYKTTQLVQQRGYREKTADEVRQYLSSNADSTFLWVALVCQELQKTRQGKALQKVKSFPSGLDALYERMMQQIRASEDAELCTQVLAFIAMAYRPPSLTESTIFIEEDGSTVEDPKSLQEIFSQCRSFLTVRGETIYFVHQSAKDFLVKEKSAILSADQQAAVHKQIFSKSIEAMSQALKRDMYGLRDLGFPIEDVPWRRPDPDPLATIGYSCVYWASHLIDAGKVPGEDNGVQAYEAVDRFLRGKGLYWIESLSLLRHMSEGMHILERLIRHLQAQPGASGLQALVKDAYRLLQTFRPAIERRPLQAYAAPLVLSPRQSLIRGLFAHEAPRWAQYQTKLAEQWSACEAVLEGHNGIVYSAAFSADGRRVVSASDDHTVRLWDAQTGTCEAVLEGHTFCVTSAAFSADGRRVVSAGGQTVRLWDAQTGTCDAVLEGHNGIVNSAAFSADGRRVVSASDDKTVWLWDAQTGTCNAVLDGHTDWVRSAAFSDDGRRVVSASRDKTVRLWDAQTGTCDAVLDGHTFCVTSAAFSADGRRVVSASRDTTVRLWDAQTGTCDAVLEGHNDIVNSAAFSADGRRVVSASDDDTVRLWDAQTGTCDAVLDGHNNIVYSAAFSADGRRVVSASHDHTVRLWDAQTGTCDAVLDGHTDWVRSAAFSADGRRVVSASHDHTVRLWDAQTGTCDAVLEGHNGIVNSATFSADGRRVVSASRDETVRLWDAQTGVCLRTYHVGHTSTFAFDPTGTRIHTDKGAIRIDEAMLGEDDTYLPKSTPAPAPQEDFSLSVDGAWIQQQSHPVLWLPPEYRPVASSVFATERGTNLVLGCLSGRVYLFHLSRF